MNNRHCKNIATYDYDHQTMKMFEKASIQLEYQENRPLDFVSPCPRSLNFLDCRNPQKGYSIVGDISNIILLESGYIDVGDGCW